MLITFSLYELYIKESKVMLLFKSIICRYQHATLRRIAALIIPELNVLNSVQKRGADNFSAESGCVDLQLKLNLVIINIGLKCVFFVRY